MNFEEISELISDTWQEDGHPSLDRGEEQRCCPRHLPVMDIMTWMQYNTSMVEVLLKRYPDKALEPLAHQSLIIQEARNYEGQAWVAYDCQYRREALARSDLNWSKLDSRDYTEGLHGTGKGHCTLPALP